MFYKYTHEMSKEDAQKLAKMSRAKLVLSLIDAYKEISKIDQKSQELTAFLSALLQQIEVINQCNNPTDRFKPVLQSSLYNLEDHHNYQHIVSLFNECLSAIETEANEAKDRDKFATQNKLAKIKNAALYTASIPTVGVVAGAILAVFYPLGLIVAGAAIIALIMAEIVFWAKEYQEYQRLQSTLNNMDLEADYGEGYALPLSELPQDPNRANKPTLPVVPKETGVILSKDTDALINASIEVGQQVLTEFGYTLTKASESLYRFWSNANATPAVTSTATKHLHTL